MTRHAMWMGALAMLAVGSAGCGGAGEDPSSEVQAVEAQPLVARPASLDLGAVPVGTTTTQRVALLNNGRDVVDVTDVTFVASFPPDPCRAVVIQPCIRPGETTSLAVTCSPTTAGSFGGRVAISYHSGTASYVLSVAVTGSATSR